VDFRGSEDHDSGLSTSRALYEDDSSNVSKRPSVGQSVQTSAETTASPLNLQHARFASRELLCPWFPEADPTHKRAQTLSAKLSRRNSVLMSACLTSFVVFAINLVGTLVLATNYPDGRLITSNCTTTTRLNAILHLLINLLSSILLGASNLCMQLLSAPTRAEIDKAHAMKKWLDIGIPSIRNLTHIASQRKFVWVALAAASLPLHFL
jgi:hypothetical protein